MCLLKWHWHKRVGVSQRIQLAICTRVAEQRVVVRGKEGCLLKNEPAAAAWHVRWDIKRKGRARYS